MKNVFFSNLPHNTLVLTLPLPPHYDSGTFSSPFPPYQSTLTDLHRPNSIIPLLLFDQKQTSVLQSSADTHLQSLTLTLACLKPDNSTQQCFYDGSSFSLIIPKKHYCEQWTGNSWTGLLKALLCVTVPSESCTGTKHCFTEGFQVTMSVKPSQVFITRCV